MLSTSAPHALELCAISPVAQERLEVASTHSHVDSRRPDMASEPSFDGGDVVRKRSVVLGGEPRKRLPLRGMGRHDPPLLGARQ
jgi:hypothetical protein